jgi:hypothetical protein
MMKDDPCDKPARDDAPARPVPGGIAPRPLPPEGFDPETAPDEELERYGLPTERAMARNAAASGFRRAFLRRRPDGPPLRFLLARGPGAGAPPSGVRPIAALATWPSQKSVNWSGGYVAPRDGRSFVAVMGTWTVPAVSAPPGGTAAEYRSSTWIGLDGQKFYLDSSLPQTGTLQRWVTGPVAKAEYSAWFQWWARGQDNPQQDLALPVAAGDEMRAIITVLDETTVVVALRNVTQDAITAFFAFAPTPCRISGATAEWIMERPSPMGSDGWEAYELPVYTPFAFSGCVAESIAPGRLDLQDHDIEIARLIRMYQIDADPTSVRTISTARRVVGPPLTLELSHVPP